MCLVRQPHNTSAACEHTVMTDDTYIEQNMGEFVQCERTVKVTIIGGNRVVLMV